MFKRRDFLSKSVVVLLGSSLFSSTRSSGENLVRSKEEIFKAYLVLRSHYKSLKKREIEGVCCLSRKNIIIQGLEDRRFNLDNADHLSTSDIEFLENIIKENAWSSYHYSAFCLDYSRFEKGEKVIYEDFWYRNMYKKTVLKIPEDYPIHQQLKDRRKNI